MSYKIQRQASYHLWNTNNTLQSHTEKKANKLSLKKKLHTFILNKRMLFYLLCKNIAGLILAPLSKMFW